MQLSHIPLDQLHVAAVNMRHSKRAPDVSDILPSVRARGILQPLLVRPNAEGFEIVAGRRRYFCAKAVAAEQGAFAPLPCAIMEAGDDAAAVEASLIENIARVDADEIAQYETFTRLATEGRSVAQIAATFGISERAVKQRFASWEFEKTPRKKGGKVFITVSHNGEVEVFEGWLTRKEARRASKGETSEAGKPANDTHPQMTQAMENYLELHRHAVVRLALLRDPAAALRLMVAHALAPTGNWNVKPDAQRARTTEIGASVTGCVAQTKFEDERKAVETLLNVSEDADTVAIFSKLHTLTDADVLRIATFAMAQSLAVGDMPVEAMGVYLKANAGEVWKPDDVFYDLLRDRATVNLLVAELAGKTVAKSNANEKVKTQKKIIRDCLAGENWRSKVDGWLPGWMQFPFKPYGKGACRIAETRFRTH